MQLTLTEKTVNLLISAALAEMSEPSLKQIAVVKQGLEEVLMDLTPDQERCLLTVLFYERCVIRGEKNV